MQRLAGKNVLVTGASSGIGQAIAVRFAGEGANVAINYRTDLDGARATEQKIDRIVADAGRRSARQVVIRADLVNEEDVVAMVQMAVDELGSLDVLVNNAGVQVSCPSHEIKTEDFDRVVAVDLRGAFLCAREAIKHFLSRDYPGVVLNVSSVHQLIPKPQYLSYSVSKGGMANLTRTLALEYSGRGIRVNAVAPGAIVTPMNRAWTEDAEARAAVEAHIPMGRAGTAEEIASAAAFMASDEAAYITGQTLYVDGGLTLYPAFREAWSSAGQAMPDENPRTPNDT